MRKLPQHYRTVLTKWEVFKDGSDLEAYTSSILDYVQFCTDSVLPTESIKVFPNQIPGCDSTVRSLLRTRNATYRSGDRLAYSKAGMELKTGIQRAKNRYRQQIAEHFADNDPRQMCRGIRTLTDFVEGLDQSAIDHLKNLLHSLNFSLPSSSQPIYIIIINIKSLHMYNFVHSIHNHLLVF